MKAIPRCPATFVDATFWCTAIKFMFDASQRVSQYHAAWWANDISIAAGNRLISASPHYIASKWFSTMQVRGLDTQLNNIVQTPSVFTATYDLLFDYTYKPGASVDRLAQVYSSRWCMLAGWNMGNGRAVATAASEQLRWLSARVPPKVHAANVRFHFNGFHTARRYQRLGVHCLFCEDPSSEDSIEHLMVCSVVQNLLPNSLKSGVRNRVPPSYFFLLQGDDVHRVAFACIIYAVYTIHNQIRNGADKGELRHQIFRTLVDTPFNKRSQASWKQLLSWHQPFAPGR